MLINKNTKKMVFLSILLILFSSSFQNIFANQLYNPNNDKNDQQQTQSIYPYSLSWPNKLAQSFIPTLDIITRVHLSFSTYQSPSDLEVSIKEGLTGQSITSLIIPSTYLSIYPEKALLDCDLPDAQITPGQTYYIIVKLLEERTPQDCIYWWYDIGDKYTRGTGWDCSIENSSNWVEIELDFCFKTYGYNSGENRAPNKPTTPDGFERGIINEKYEFSTKSIDPDGDNISYGWDWNSDDIVDTWSYYHGSNVKTTMNYSWTKSGYHYVQVKAKDEEGLESSFSSKHMIYISDSNHPPEKPNTPLPVNNSEENAIDVSLSWECSDIDNDDWLKYDVYFGKTSTPPLKSNKQEQTTYDPGILQKNTEYYWRIVACDSYNTQAISPIWKFSTINDNNKPTPPNIVGPTNGIIQNEYTFKFTSIDPEDDDIYLYIDWGDETYMDWEGPFKSNQEILVSKTYNSSGDYDIKSISKDTIGLTSNWSEPYTISVTYKNSWLIGRLSNYKKDQLKTTFNAEKITMLNLKPISTLRYENDEEFTIKNEHLGLINSNFVIGKFKIQEISQ